MTRARSKKELIDFAKIEIAILFENLDIIQKNNLITEYVFLNRNPKDILAHLVAWHKLMINWYETGMSGKKPEIPAPGLTFKDTPKLNEILFKEYQNIEYEVVVEMFNKTATKLENLIQKHTDTELFEKKKYNWTGSSSLGSYFASATSSHYVWANSLLKKFIKKQHSQE